MWAFAILALLGIAAVVHGIKEVLTGKRRPLVVTGVVGASLFLGNMYYDWELGGDVLVILMLGIAGGIRFVEK